MRRSDIHTTYDIYLTDVSVTYWSFVVLLRFPD